MTEFPPRIDVRHDTVMVSAAGREIGFVLKALPAFRLLLSARPVEVDKVAAATGIDAAVLAEVLVAEEICVEVTSDLVSGYAELLMPEAL
jgi:hypothetical protein